MARKSAWRTGTAALAALLSVAAMGQLGDFPTLKGDNARTGQNGDPNNTGPGQAFLHWFNPRISFDLKKIVLDNTDVVNTQNAFAGQGPFDPTLNGSNVGSAWYNPKAANPDPAVGWAWPNTDQEAVFPYLLPIRRAQVGTFTPNPNSRFPAYLYTRVTPSDRSGDPRRPIDPNDLRQFRYTINGFPGQQRTYALYVWIPVGPTLIGATRTFPERFFVYDIHYGPGGNLHYTDVVDTYASGGGWVRLGAGGAPTNKVFPWDGTNPITILLDNTVARFNNTLELTMPHPINDENGVKQFLVYADAVKAVPATGYYEATPVAGRLNPADALSNRLFAAKNELTVGTDSSTNVNGVITSYAYTAATKSFDPVWKFDPASQTSDTNVTEDNTTATRAGIFVADTTSTRYAGADDYIADVKAATSGTVTYQPTLPDGTYEIYAYLPGNNNGLQFGQAVEYQINAEGTSFVIPIDQSLKRGWVRIADRRFAQINKTAKISVIVTNRSGLATDLTKKAYADAIRFVGEKNQAITSTPVYATAKIMKAGVPTTTKVVIVADESGHIHCLDAAGNSDGTTTEYWAYPSTTTPDPNEVDGLDGVGGVAEMPTGFELSTAIVQRVGAEDFLYIGSTNGRVYCISMAGRGDYTLRTAGTTTRKWTFPATYPTDPAIEQSPLGAFHGSLLFSNTGNSPTIYVPASQGRIYALDARGKADKSTTIRWAFPAETNPALGSVWMTPTIQFGNLYFGTLVKNDVPGRFFCVNATSGLMNWELAPPAALPRAFDNFLASPAVVSYATLDPTNPTPPVGGVVYTVNQNRVVYAADALTGTMLWQTDELGVGARGSITYTSLSAYNNLGVPAQFPIIMIPTLDGRFDGLFANNQVNRYGTKRAWEYTAEGDSLTASISVANSFMFGADNAGFLYAFANTKGSFLPNEDLPGQESIVENNPAGDIFRKAKLKLITRDGYQKLRLPNTDPNALSYTQAMNPAISFTRSPLAFEWGETAYIMVYDFPFVNKSPNNNIVPPPIVNVSFNVDGKTIRGVAIEARQFKSTPAAPKLRDIQPNVGQPVGPEGDLPVDGYAVLAFPFQGGGANALPPGDAEITFTISTQSLNNNGAQQNVVLDPALARVPFKMANPLAIAMRPNVANAEIGLDVNPGGPERLTNGSGGTKINIGTSTGYAQHGLTKGTQILVYDTSMMGLLRPDGLGLDGVRMERQDLARQAGKAGVMKPFSSTLYPNFEDYPVNSPNTSVDYPDIAREQIRATKDPNGTAENPLFNGVELNSPLIKDPSAPGGTRPMMEGDKPEDRVFVPTIFQLDVDVPKYQPPVLMSNAAAVPNSEGQTWNTGYLQGYMGRLSVFVDSFQNGNLDVAQREAFRSFNLATAVVPDERISVNTPSIDLGSLPSGAGYSVLASPGEAFNPSVANLNERVFQPWGGIYAPLFKEFNVQNEGNVNMLNMRLAKMDGTSGSLNPWFVPAKANDPLGWLEPGWQVGGTNQFTGNVWTDLDWQFSPWTVTNNADRNVILQKPRVTDRIPTTLTVNPRRRANANLKVTDSALFNESRFPVQNPRIAVTVPIGQPVGHYAQRMKIIEDKDGPSRDVVPTWTLDNGFPEPASDPTFDLLFNVRESRLTNSYTPGGDRMIDDLIPGGTPPDYTNSNAQPAVVRDAFGNLVVAFASNRSDWNSTVPPTSDTNNSWHIYLATLDNAWTFGTAPNSGMSGPAGQNPQAPLRDLSNWIAPNKARWFNRAVQNFPPNAPNRLFGAGPGESIIANTVKYGSPSFPQTGVINPFNAGSVFTGMFMGFVGEAQKLTPTGRQTESRLFLSVITTQADGSLQAAAPVVMGNDPLSLKGKPSVVQTPSGAMVFYGASAGSSSRIFYTRFDGTNFGPSSPLPFGTGFDSVTSPSAAGRLYRGVNTAENGNSVVDLTFGGKLRGRPYSEVFMGRLRALTAGGNSGTGADRLPENQQGALDEANAFVWMPTQVRERLAPEDTGTYRSRGVVWNLTAGFNIVQNNGGSDMDLIVPGSQTYDQQTGVLSYNTRLGGQMYVDPAMGTVRFSGGQPPRTANLYITYTPRFLRVSPDSTAGYAGPVGLYDSRLVSDLTYWRLANGAPPVTNSPITNDRYVFTYNRAAAGSAQAARPYITTLRFGVRLPYRVLTNPDGSPNNIQVTGNVGPYQVDPAQARVYFTSADEGSTVTVNYTGVDDAGAAVTGLSQTGTVAFVTERSEEPILIEQAVNESGMVPFLDPFTYFTDRRPGMVWLFWTSTRAGSPDLYFETIAPNWTPVPLLK